MFVGRVERLVKVPCGSAGVDVECIVLSESQQYRIVYSTLNAYVTVPFKQYNLMKR